VGGGDKGVERRGEGEGGLTAQNWISDVQGMREEGEVQPIHVASCGFMGAERGKKEKGGREGHRGNKPRVFSTRSPGHEREKGGKGDLGKEKRGVHG